MKIVKEITVILENHPGTLARVTAALRKRSIDIHGFNLTNALDYGALRLVVDDPTGAVHLFGEHNMLALEGEVLAIELRHEVGALTRLAGALADAGVNIEYAYGSAGGRKGPGTLLYARVSDNDKALAVLAGIDGIG